MKSYSNTSVRVTKVDTPLGYLYISFTIGIPPCQGGFQQKKDQLVSFSDTR